MEFENLGNSNVNVERNFDNLKRASRSMLTQVSGDPFFGFCFFVVFFRMVSGRFWVGLWNYFGAHLTSSFHRFSILKVDSFC